MCDGTRADSPLSGSAMTPTRLLLALLVAVTGCATPAAPRSDSPAVSPKLKTFLGGLCAAMQAEACRPELKQVDERDLATVVIADLGEQEPEFGDFLTRALAGVEPAKRKATIEQRVGDALGAPWTCATLDAVWANQRPACE